METGGRCVEPDLRTMQPAWRVDSWAWGMPYPTAQRLPLGE